jgi:hypothetical protein
MIATKERAAALARARRAIKLLIEHDAPTQQDLGAARDRLNECYNLPEPTQVWDAVDRLEDTAAQTYGVPDVDQARLEGIPTATARSPMRPEERAVDVEAEAPAPVPSS